MEILGILFLVLPIIYCSCPVPFELVENGECRVFYGTVNVLHCDAAKTAISICDDWSGLPVMIHTESQQAYWTDEFIKKGNTLPIGLVCSTTSNRWQWADGSAIDYTPPTYNELLHTDCDSAAKTSWVINDTTGYWDHWIGAEPYYDLFDIFCTAQLHPPIPNADGCDGFEDDSEDAMCYQIGSTSETWNDAQKQCKQLGADLASIHNLKENSFVRRLAISRGVLNGLFLGATTSGKNNDFGWIDGTEWDYDNFYAGFPVDGLGNCVVMDTAGSTSGEWVNADCSSSFSAACVRSQREHACSKGPWKEGEIITSPGFPFDASIPCDYMFSVDAGKRVELEVSFLEANTCCDHLVLYENFIGETIIANLTGEVSDRVFKTKSSNYMRVSWNPNGGVNVKGIMISFRAV